MAVRKVTRQYDYSDLDLDFIPHPTTKDVLKKTGVDAVKRSLRNLILTNFYDRPFRSSIGSNVNRLLFDNISILAANLLRDFIIVTIVNFEPRVQLTNDEEKGVSVTEDLDNNGYRVQIRFTVQNSGAPTYVNLFLERIR